MIVVLVVIFMSIAREQRKLEDARQNSERALNYARHDYERALHILKMNPRDANLKQATLAYGRKYSFLTHDKSGITTFDEMALMNDLNAATAHAFEIPRDTQASVMIAQTQSLSHADRFRKLDDLKNQGLITEEEFAARRAKILEEL